MNEPKLTKDAFLKLSKIACCAGDADALAIAAEMFAALEWIEKNTQHTGSRERASAALALARREGKP